MLFNIHTMLSNERGQRAFRQTLKYNFVEIDDSNINEMMDNLKEFHSHLNQTEDKLDDDKLNAHYLSIILSVFQDSARKYPMSHEEFLDKKAERIKSIILQIDPTLSGKKNIKLMDIGCGDCQMTRRVAVKLDAVPTGVELSSADDATMWAGDSGTSSQLDQDIVYYDGVHLIQGLAQKTKAFSELFDVITFNHVLHHYPDRNAQIEGLQNAIATLKEGGVLLFSEHATVLNDEYFELQHVFFDIKNLLRNHASPLSQEEMISFCEEGLKEYVQHKHEANYFSLPLLNKISEALGLKRVVCLERTPEIPDASSTMFTGFVKTLPTLTPENVESFEPKKLSELMQGPLKSLEEGDQELPRHKSRLFSHESSRSLRNKSKGEDEEKDEPNLGSGI